MACVQLCIFFMQKLFSDYSLQSGAQNLQALAGGGWSCRVSEMCTSWWPGSDWLCWACLRGEGGLQQATALRSMHLACFMYGVCTAAVDTVANISINHNTVSTQYTSFLIVIGKTFDLDM